MAVNGPNTVTDAQSNQIPPAIRKFARDHCLDVDTIKRYSDENETVGRGWYIYAKSVSGKHIPDGFETRNVSVSVDGFVRYQIREA